MGVRTLKRAVFLDRDGVLNHVELKNGKPHPPPTAADVRLIDGAAANLSRLKELGFILLVVTNQPDVSRGTQTMDEVNAINAVLNAALPLDAFFVCPHDSGEGCPCRKPKPGLLLDGAKDWNVSLPQSYMIGDRWRDIDAAAAAGVPGIWIDYGYNEKGPAAPPAATVKSLREAVEWIINQENRT